MLQTVMERGCTLAVFLLVTIVTRVIADYDCVCNYAVENAVYQSPDVDSQPTGYMYEFDCKQEVADDSDFYVIASEHKVCYIQVIQFHINLFLFAPR